MLIGKKIIKLDTVDSTNLFAQRLISSEKQPEGTVICSKVQTSGKGYDNAVWFSESGRNLLISIVLYPKFLEARRAFLLNQIVALSIESFLNDILKSNDHIRIKWPNDIYYKDSKIAGILITNSIEGEIIRDTIIGIGININETDFPSDLTNPISLRLITKEDYSLEECLNILLKSINTKYLQLKSGNYHQIHNEYLQKLYKFNSITVFRDSNNEKFNGHIINVSEDGKLHVKRNNEVGIYGFKEIDYVF